MQKWKSDAVIWRTDNRQHNSQRKNDKTTIVDKTMHWKLRLNKLESRQNKTTWRTLVLRKWKQFLLNRWRSNISFMCGFSFILAFPCYFLVSNNLFYFFSNFSVANDGTFILTNMCISLITSQLAFIGAENAYPERVSVL